MTDTENLVERLREAAKRADYFQTGEQELLNRAAQAIAKLSAQTPTDDEREAMIDAIRRSVAGTHGIQAYLAGVFADAILAAGFHRGARREASIPDPPPRCLVCGEEVENPGGLGFRHVKFTPGPQHRINPESQGEPSDAQLLAQGFRDGVDFIDDQPGPWGAAVVAGRAEAARRVAAAGGVR